MSETVRVRFAPAPTGSLHIGGVRTALYNWLFARHHGGEFILRLEDTDRERSTEESIKAIVEDMEWLGLGWDRPVPRQSERLEVYRQHAHRLVEEGKAYRCYCSPEELTAMREEMRARKETARYDGRCRNRTQFPEGQPFVIRLRVDPDQEIHFDDKVYGSVSVDTREIDDFVLIKSDGYPAYNFACVIDDHEMGMTHVIRGEDGITNTPRQILLYRFLGWDIPVFAHLPMILGQDGSKLSKRHGAVSVAAYRDMGYLPDGLLNYLARLGWAHGDQEVFTRQELIDFFTLEAVNKSQARFNEEKCQWVNGEHLRTKPADEVAVPFFPFLVRQGLLTEEDREILQTDRFTEIVDSLKERCKTLVEMAEKAGFFFRSPDYDPQAVQKHWKPDLVPSLEKTVEKIGALPDSPDVEDIEIILRETAEQHGLKMRVFAQAIRVALTGGTVSPPLDRIIRILGKETVRERLASAVARMREMEG
jgi:glutamyl-tRNA synthetase